jgi:ABC-type transport system involved in multi-copper enzyme maturation permease subunit
MKIMLGRKEYRFSILAVLVYSCFSFVYVLMEFWGMDISVIKDANQSVGYSQLHRLWFFFSMVYPFLIVLPFSTSYLDDYQNRLLPVYLSRSSRQAYYLSKLLASFLGTSMVIAIPFLLNLLLCNLFLPHNHNTWFGEYQMGNFYRQLLGTNLLYTTSDTELPFLKLYLYSPFLYNLLYLFFFSLFSGLLGALVLGFSFWWKKHKIALFVPVFLVMQLLQVYDAWSLSDAIENGSRYRNFNILDYVVPSVSKGRAPSFLLVVLVVMAAVLVCSVIYALKEDLRSIQ